MASLAMHLAIADMYVSRHGDEDMATFIEGAYTPDMSKDKVAAHYGVRVKCANAKEFFDNKINIHKCISDLDFDISLDRAKFLHLFTDYVFYKYIYCDLLEERFFEADSVIYKDFDYTTNYILSHYTIPVPKEVSHIVHMREGDLAPILTTDSMIDAMIEVMSSVDILECRDMLLKDEDTLVERLLSKLHSISDMV